MPSEKIMNDFYNVGGFNKPERIGYMMSMIRKLHPITVDEWRVWYLDNVHDEAYINNIVIEMHKSIPSSYSISESDCKNYVYDVMFRRTFQGYDKEGLALNYLKSNVSENVHEAPKEWDTDYFIDFFIPEENKHPIIGIQLKPETFYKGHYQNIVDIDGKMNKFCSEYRALAYVLKYKSFSTSSGIEFVNPDVINGIKNIIS